MLTGKRAFEGEDITYTLTAIMRDTPDVNALPTATPPVVAQLITRCLEKDPRSRLRDIGEARVMLDGRGLTPPLTAIGAPLTSLPPAPRARLAWSVAAVATIIAAVTTTLWVRPRPETIAPQVQFEITAGVFFVDANGPDLALSPDGRRLAFATPAAPGTPPRLWVRSLDAVTAVPLPGTESALDPFWSPDGTSLAFIADDKLKRVAASGGPVQTLCDAEDAFGGSWSSENVIAFSGPNGLMRVAAAGGVATPLTTVDQSRGELSHRWPFFLPGGQKPCVPSRRSE
jgi:serine/threonine-protein kinase